MDTTDVVIRREGAANVAVVLLRRITGEASEDCLWEAIGALADRANPGTLILDWRQVQHASSPGLGRLLGLAKQCRQSRTRLVIRGLCPSLRHLFELLRFDVLLEIEADGTAAEGTMP